MTGFNRNSVNVLGINVANLSFVASLRTNGTVPAKGQTSMEYLSFTRHLMQYPDADTKGRPEQPEMGEFMAALWAGRPGASAGVLPCPSSARFAEQAIRFGWPSFGRVPAAILGNNPSKVVTTRTGLVFSTHSRIPPKRGLQAGKIHCPALLATKQRGGSLASAKPVCGMRRSAAGGN